MAEFALGLTKTAVAGTVSSVKLAIEEETKLRVRVQDDLVFITGEFEMIQSFLNVANAERTNNKVVRTWVRQLRDVAFDVEDCVEFIVHLDKASRWDWVRRLASSILICMEWPPLPLDVAVADVKRLKARVEDVSQRNTRYKLIADSGSNSNSNSNSNSRPVSSLAPELMLEAAGGASKSSAFHILREVWEDTGKLRGAGSLRKLITGEGRDLEVISVWGSPGTSAHLGVTHVMKEAYNDREICQEFKIRAWVKLMHPFNPDELLKSLLAQFHATSRKTNTLDHIDFRKMKDDQIVQQLSELRYLVIVEELSTLVEWDAIRMYLPGGGKNGSRIVVVTQQLGLALSCTGEPYQVSELRQFSDGESLYAFFNKVPWRRSDLGDFIWQLRRRGTISVWGVDDGESSLVDKVYTCIIHKSKEFDGLEFRRHNWVNVPDPFDLNVFCSRLFLNFHSVGLRAEEIAAVGMMGHTGIIQECCRFLREDDCFVVINGLKSTDDWKLIKDTLLSEPTKGSIIVITEEESLAVHCADEKDRAFSVEDLKADAVLHHWIKDFQFYRTGGKEEGRFFSTRKNRARDWTNMFGDATNYYSKISDSLLTCFRFPGVVSLWGPAGAGKSGLVRRLYYRQLLQAYGDLGFTKLSWVDVVHPFNLTDFSWELLVDFHSDNPEAKQNAALGMIKGQDPVAECRKVLCEHKCLVVINGLHDWDCVKDVLLSGSTNSCIIVITTEETVAMHCGAEKDRVFNVKGVEAGKHGLPPYIKTYRDDSDEEEGSLRALVFSNRMEKARDWMDKLDHGVHLKEWSAISERLRSESPGVISVWGIAGVGISTLIKSIYYNRMLGLKHQRYIPGKSSLFYYQKEFTMFSWVHVPHPFNLKEFSWHLLLDFLSDDPEAKENAIFCMMEGHDPIERCRSFLHQHKCFVVIDALQSTHDWDLIKVAFLSKPIKGCIVVNTYEASVAAHCAPAKESVFNIKGLEPDVALHLFQKVAWGGKILSPEEAEVSKITIAKCGGLPKVIAAIGQYFGNGRFSISRSELERINDDFMGNLENEPAFDNLRGLFSWMQSYFDACSDSVKPCIFYLSVFPADHKSIRPSRLVRRWIAEGYSRDRIGSTAEEDGEVLFSELVKLSIIQQHQQSPSSDTSSSKVGMCQANGFFREYIISRPMEDNLVFALEGRCSPNSQRAGRHLTVSSSWDRDKIVYESIDFTRLRSLTVFGKWMSFFVSDNMRFLRVLDLEDTLGVADDDLEQIFKLLRRLKFLSLRGCWEITRLPDSLCKMRQLQTLDLKLTSIVTLPASITKLQRLQYIHAGSTMPSNGEAKDTTVAAAAAPPKDDDGTALSPPTIATPPPDHDNGALEKWSNKARDLVSTWLSNVNKLGRRQLEIENGGGVEFVLAAARGVGKLTALHTLGVINVHGAGGKLFFKELKKLTQLRKLRLSGISRKNWQDMWCAISGHGYLASLFVRLDCNKQQQKDLYCLDDISEPPKTLKSLKLYGGNVHVSLAWIKQLDNLKKAHLGDLELTVSTQEDIDILMKLPCKTMVRHIRIKPIQDGMLCYGLMGEAIGHQFTAAKILNIECGNYRCEIDLLAGWKYVEVLVVHCSTTDASLELSGLDNIFSLKEIRLKGSYSEAIEQHLQQKLAEYEFLRGKRPVVKMDPQQSLC